MKSRYILPATISLVLLSFSWFGFSDKTSEKDMWLTCLHYVNEPGGKHYRCAEINNSHIVSIFYSSYVSKSPDGLSSYVNTINGYEYGPCIKLENGKKCKEFMNNLPKK